MRREPREGDIWITAPKLVRANSCNAFLVANEEKMAQSHVPTKNNENNQELPDSQETLVLQGDEPPAPVPKQEERPRSDHLQGSCATSPCQTSCETVHLWDSFEAV